MSNANKNYSPITENGYQFYASMHQHPTMFQRMDIFSAKMTHIITKVKNK